jgi:hypothetical protein
MRRRRWAEAAHVFAQIEPRDAGTEMKRLLSRNLAEFQVRHPHLYQQLLSLPATDAFGIAASTAGYPTVLAKRDDGSVISLSGGSNPLASAQATLSQIKQATPNGESVALCGVGDGYLLQLLSQYPPALFMDTQQAVFVLEPRPQVLLHALMIHDFAGPTGPIAAERVRWFIGPDWAHALNDAVQQQPSIGLPITMIQQGLDAATIRDEVQAALQRLAARDTADKREIENYCAALTPEYLADLFGPNPPRAPRVALITTRFSTVLQFATRDTAEAFRELGWNAQVLIEPTPSHRLYRHAIRQAVADFKPDLVFQIDHLRSEHKELFPQDLPYICWIQDHLPQLKTPAAAASITSNDFVLTDAGPVYATTFGYPCRQIIGLNKLTRIPPATPKAETFEHDLCFVSNASYECEVLLATRVKEYDGSSAGRELLDQAGAHLLATYAAERSVPTWIELLAMVRQVREELSLDVSAEEVLSLAAWLFHPFNDALYRQQALAWAAEVASSLKLDFALYGRGWEKNARFAKYARGPVAYGGDLERVTRRSRFNLQIVPYLCLHQRLLDGIAAGGFYLVRRHAADTEVGALLKLLDTPHADETELRRLVAACHPALASSENDDVIEIARHWRETCLIDTDYSVLPEYPRTSFGSGEELRRSIEQFIQDPQTMHDIRQRQRESVTERFSYTSGIRRVLTQVQRLISENRSRAKSVRAAA